jgi:hypothetical protein
MIEIDGWYTDLLSLLVIATDFMIACDDLKSNSVEMIDSCFQGHIFPIAIARPPVFGALMGAKLRHSAQFPANLRWIAQSKMREVVIRALLNENLIWMCKCIVLE